MKILVMAVLLITSVSRTVFRELVKYTEKQCDECVFPLERWAVIS